MNLTFRNNNMKVSTVTFTHYALNMKKKTTTMDNNNNKKFSSTNFLFIEYFCKPKNVTIKKQIRFSNIKKKVSSETYIYLS